MAEGKGWISLYRNIQDNWLWQEKPYDKAHAWIDLLLSANHQDKKTVLGSELLHIKRGYFVTSQKKLMQRWGWGNTKVRSFLELLKADGMIEYSGKRYTKVHILNYEMYQNQTVSSQGTSTVCGDKQIDNKSSTNRNQTDAKSLPNTNNNDNNDNNENNDNNVNNKYSQNSNEFRLASYLLNYIKRNNPKAKEPNLQKWCKQFDYILRIDKRDIEEVKAVIKWCQGNDFWFKNILSPNKLREKYDTLYLQMGGNKINEPSKQHIESEDREGIGIEL